MNSQKLAYEGFIWLDELELKERAIFQPQAATGEAQI